MTSDLFSRTLSGEIMMYGLCLLKGRGDPEPPFDRSGTRLRRVRAALGLTQTEFGQALGGLAWHKVRDLESGKACLTPQLAWSIERKFKINFRWLLTGEGPVRLDERDDRKRKLPRKTFPAQERRHDISLGEKLKRYRQFRGFSRLKLARRIGINPESIARYERGDREPNATTVEKLAAALGITPNKLLGVGEDEKNAR